MTEEERKITPERIESEERYAGLETSYSKLQEENEQLKTRVNELTALLYRITDQMDNDFFNYQASFMNNQNLAKSIKGRLAMTSEVWDIVNKSRQAQEEPNS